MNTSYLNAFGAAGHPQAPESSPHGPNFQNVPKMGGEGPKWQILFFCSVFVVLLCFGLVFVIVVVIVIVVVWCRHLGEDASRAGSGEIWVDGESRNSRM